MKSREWEVMPLEGNKESTAVIVGANTTVPSPDIPIRISFIIVVEIWRFYNARRLHFGNCRWDVRTILFLSPDIPIRISKVKVYLGDKHQVRRSSSTSHARKEEL